MLRPTSIALLAASLALVGCAEGGTRGGSFTYECPDAPVVHLSLIDLSSSGRSERLIAERLDAVQVDAEFVADCEGLLVVQTWAGSAGTAEVLYSGTIPIAGATEIGRDRKIPAAVMKVMDDVRRNLNAALSRNGSLGNDVLGALSIVADIAQRHASSGSTFRATIYTDAVSTEGSAAINAPGLTPERVGDIVANQRLPRLEGTQIAFRGVGRVGGDVQPPQDYVDVVKIYVTELCEATGATCSVFVGTAAVG